MAAGRFPAHVLFPPTSGDSEWNLRVQTVYESLRPSVCGCSADGDVDVQGVVKSTVVRGEEEFPSGLLRVSDCHDSVLYALAPLQFASIYCCSDCTVVRSLPPPILSLGSSSGIDPPCRAK